MSSPNVHWTYEDMHVVNAVWLLFKYFSGTSINMSWWACLYKVSKWMITKKVHFGKTRFIKWLHQWFHTCVEYFYFWKQYYPNVFLPFRTFLLIEDRISSDWGSVDWGWLPGQGDEPGRGDHGLQVARGRGEVVEDALETLGAGAYQWDGSGCCHTIGVCWWKK